MTCLGVLLAIGAAAWAIDRLLVWCELRGWIYYRLTPRPMRSAIGNTLLTVEELYRPSRRHVIELQQDQQIQREEDDEGGAGSGAPGGMMPSDSMAVSDGFLAFVLDQLEGLGSVTSRRMFGGVGLYRDDLFFAILAGDALYLKVDEVNQPLHEAAGMQPFRPYPDRAETMLYYGVPVDVLEHAPTLVDWARRAVEAATRQRAATAGRASTNRHGLRQRPARHRPR